MKSREHVFWGLMSFSISMFVFSIVFDYRHAGAMTWLGLLLPILLAVIANEIANMIEFKRTEEGRARKVNAKDPALAIDQRDKKDKIVKGRNTMMDKTEARCRILAYVFLGTVIVVCTYVAIPSLDNPAYLVLAYIAVVAGATFPDFLDSTIPGSMEFHRDPWTHSSIFTAAIGIGMLILIRYADSVSLNLPFIGFVMANMSHLVADNVESDSTLADLIKRPMKWSESPGDIRHIRENRERDWLLLNAIFSAVVLYFQFARYSTIASGTWTDQLVIYDFYNGAFSLQFPAGVMLGTIGIFYLVTLVAFIAWRDRKKEKHGTYKHDHDAKRSTPAHPVAAKKAPVKKPAQAAAVNESIVMKPAVEPIHEETGVPASKPAKRPAKKAAVGGDGKPVVKPAKPRAKRAPKPAA